MSKKKYFILGIIILFLVTLAGVGFYLYSRSNQGNPPPLSDSQNKLQAEDENVEWLTYEDEAGFSLEYPSVLGIVEKDVRDNSVYSSLELSGKSHPGEKIIVKIFDVTETTVEKWLEENPQDGKITDSSDFTLSKMKGKRLKYEGPSRNLILVIDSGILYFLQSPSDRGFWDQVFEKVSSSFKLTEEKNGAAGSGGSVIEEVEEIIQ